MEGILNKVKDFLKTNKSLAIATSVIALLTATKLYCRGSICKVDKNLDGKVIVVTGGNSGIGKVTVQELSSKKCTIIFGARDNTKSEKVVQGILNKNKDSKVLFFHLDLADKKSIEEFSQKVKENCVKIDVLINNAGLFKPQRALTRDGFEMTMGVNHLGHFYLTSLLWDSLRNSEKPRIINVASNAHAGMGVVKYNAAIDFEDINFENNYKGDLAYTRSKIANILFTRSLQQKMNEKGIEGSAVCLHPGVIPTDIPRDYGKGAQVMKIILSPLFYLFFKTAWEGAQTTLYLALQSDQKLQKGEYYKDCKPCKTSQFSTNQHNADRLWKISEQLLNIKFDI